MKKFIHAALATALTATPMIASAADAQTRAVTTVQHRPNGTVVRQTTRYTTPARQVVPANRYGERRWVRGARFDRRYAPNYRVVDYRAYRGRHLYAPPRGYQWVRSGNDAVLIGVTSGLVAAVLSGALR